MAHIQSRPFSHSRELATASPTLCTYPFNRFRFLGTPLSIVASARGKRCTAFRQRRWGMVLPQRAFRPHCFTIVVLFFSSQVQVLHPKMSITLHDQKSFLFVYVPHSVGFSAPWEAAHSHQALPTEHYQQLRAMPRHWVTLDRKR